MPGKICVVCVHHGAAAMLGSKSGFWALVQSKTPKVLFTHCFIHRKALAPKTVRCGLQDVLNITTKIINFVKSSPLHPRLFRKLCEDMKSDHVNLPYYTKVRWLSKRNVLSKVFALRNQLKIFLSGVKPDLKSLFYFLKFIACLAYL